MTDLIKRIELVIGGLWSFHRKFLRTIAKPSFHFLPLSQSLRSSVGILMPLPLVCSLCAVCAVLFKNYFLLFHRIVSRLLILRIRSRTSLFSGHISSGPAFTICSTNWLDSFGWHVHSVRLCNIARPFVESITPLQDRRVTNSTTGDLLGTFTEISWIYLIDFAFRHRFIIAFQF